MANITPSAAERVQLEKTPPPTERSGDIVTSSISKPAVVPEIDPIGELIRMSPSLAEAPQPVAEVPLSERVIAS